MADPKSSKAQTAELTRAYVPLHPVRHDGKIYLPAADGSVRLDLAEAEAAELLALGAIAPLSSITPIAEAPASADPAKS